MEHVCINCSNYDEYTCIAHSIGCEAHVNYPCSHGKDCKDFSPVDEEEVYDPNANNNNEEK